MKTRPKVSVIIPIYNKEKFLNQMLSSLSNQSYTDCEFILVNDCSTDASENICKRWVKDDNRFVLFSNDVNKGASKSRNIGLDNARGEYVCFIDADDVAHKDFLKTLIQKGDGADVIMCGASLIDEKGNVIRQLPNNFEHNGLYTGLEYWKRFQWILSSAPWNKLFKKDLLISKKTTFKDVKGPEDLLFNFDAIDSKAVVFYISEPLYYYRDLTNSLSKTFGYIEEINDIEILLKINQYLLNNNYSYLNEVTKIAFKKVYRVRKMKKNKENCESDRKLKELRFTLISQLKITKLSIKDRLYLFKSKHNM